MNKKISEKNNVLNFKDNYFTSAEIVTEGECLLNYPAPEKKSLKITIKQLKENGQKIFSELSSKDIQETLDKTDEYFCDITKPEIQALIELIQRTSGFSKHDIEKFGLGIFRNIVNYDKNQIGKFIERSIKTKKCIETEHGYLKRFGFSNPFIKWRNPGLLSHFVSGNVVGYTSVLIKMGFPFNKKGIPQIMKLPSASGFFPMVYLKKLEQLNPVLRDTIAAGYWKGGDEEIERVILANSDAVNVLGSEQTINDIQRRKNKYSPESIFLGHGHKIGVAYISSDFIEDYDLLKMTLKGLVRDISAFDGGACYTPKNIYVQGNAKKFAEKLFVEMKTFAQEVSPVSEKGKVTGKDLYDVYRGCKDVLVSDDLSSIVRMGDKSEFWVPDELFRYIKVMPVKDENEVAEILKGRFHYLQTAVIAVADNKIIPILQKFGSCGISNIHYPGSAAILNVYEEPHDGEFDFLKIRYPYKVRFTSTNFKSNKDWIEKVNVK